MQFDKALPITVACQYCHNQGAESGLVEAFAEICHFLADNPQSLSWRSKQHLPSVFTISGLNVLAQLYRFFSSRLS
ncbi:SinI family restriction endonuclease [Candidatus Oscillochloris fontis]|uniref:SinI family restriction endonuclease n=1 Tax=Candidatus Oscillochloris fontis TaxID=2496868 RepID=UPI00101C19EA